MIRFLPWFAPRHHVVSLLALLAALVTQSCLAQYPGLTELTSLVRTKDDSVGGQQIVAFTTAAAPIRSKLRVGDVIISGVIVGAEQSPSLQQREGLVMLSAALRRGQRVVLTLLRPTDTYNDPPRSYQQIQIELLPADLLASTWSRPYYGGSSWNVRPGGARTGGYDGSARGYGSVGSYGSYGSYGSAGNAGGAAVDGGAAADRMESYSDSRVEAEPIPSQSYEAAADDPPAPPGEELSEPEYFPRFPWPPPQASAIEPIGREMFGASVLLSDVDKCLKSALDATGYFDSRYYAVPPGFALVTRLEQIESDGASKQGAARWSVRPTPLQRFSLVDYVKSLFGADPGKYRVIVFIVTSKAIVTSSETITSEEASNWLLDGRVRLPKVVGARQFSPDFECTALVYEFERASKVAEPQQIAPGLPGRVHLTKSGLLGALTP